MLLGLSVLEAQAQQTPPAQGKQNTQSSPLDNVLIQETDEDNIPTALFSFVSLDYDHGSFTGGKSNNRERIKGEQDFGPNHRLGFGYEIPIIKGFGFNVNGGSSLPSGRGVGDVKLNITAILDESGRFKQAAKFEVTLPSAPDPVKGIGQTALKMAWSFSTALGEKTTLNGIFAYNKAVSAPEGTEGLNNFEPEAVLVRQITRWMAAYLDYDTYQDFVAEEFAQTLKGGLTFGLDRAGRWSLSPYAQFPLNHFTSMTNIKSDYGIEFSRRY